MLDVPVEDVEIDIGEELAAEVADRQAEVRSLVEQALVRRDERQAPGVASELAAGARVVEEDELGEAQPPGIADPRGEQVAQNLLVDRHEEVGEVAFEIERMPRPVLRDRADCRLEAARRVERAAAGDAGAAV